MDVPFAARIVAAHQQTPVPSTGETTWRLTCFFSARSADSPRDAASGTAWHTVPRAANLSISDREPLTTRTMDTATEEPTVTDETHDRRSRGLFVDDPI
jgi:hypothetical protein